MEVESLTNHRPPMTASTSQEDSTMYPQQASPEDVEPQVEAQLNREAADSEIEQAAPTQTEN